MLFGAEDVITILVVEHVWSGVSLWFAKVEICGFGLLVIEKDSASMHQKDAGSMRWLTWQVSYYK